MYCFSSKNTHREIKCDVAVSKILKRQTGTADFLRIIDVGEFEPMK